MIASVTFSSNVLNPWFRSNRTRPPSAKAASYKYFASSRPDTTHLSRVTWQWSLPFFWGSVLSNHLPCTRQASAAGQTAEMGDRWTPHQPTLSAGFDPSKPPFKRLFLPYKRVETRHLLKSWVTTICRNISSPIIGTRCTTFMFGFTFTLQWNLSNCFRH